jgi:hypothetical protein
MADAACVEHPELRFVSGRGKPTQPLKAVCRGYLVLNDCLAYAMADDSLEDVWRGTTKGGRKEWRTAFVRVREMSAGHQEKAGHNEQQRAGKGEIRRHRGRSVHRRPQ